MARSPSLILLPGMLCDDRVWDAGIVRRLEALADVHVQPMLLGTTIERMAEVVAEREHGCFAVAGFSLGGIVALELAERFPDRVTGVAAIGCSARSPTGNQTATWTELDHLVASDHLDAVVERLLPGLIDDEHRDSLGPLIREMVHRVGARVGRDQLAAQLSRPDRSSRLKGLRSPALFLAAELDTSCAVARVREMADLVPNAAFSLIEGSTHLLPLIRPDNVADRLAEWLAELPVRASAAVHREKEGRVCQVN